MSEQERFDELSAAIKPQRALAHRLHSEWSYACKVLNDLEREQSALFRKMMDGSTLPPSHCADADVGGSQ